MDLFHRFVGGLRQKLESMFPETVNHVNNSQIDYIRNLHYKNINIYFEYIHLIVLYFVILLYLYFSVRKYQDYRLYISASILLYNGLLLARQESCRANNGPV